MKRQLVTFPSGLLKHTQTNWQIDWRGQMSGEGGTGISQIVNNAFPKWVGEMSLVMHGEGLMQWRAIRTSAQGLLGVYKIEIIDPLGFDFLNNGGGIGPYGIPWGNNQMFSTGYGWSYEPFVTCLSDALRGDTNITVSVGAGIPSPKQGQIMSFDNWPFMVTSVEEYGGEYSLGIQMPLRSDVAVGDQIDLRARGLFTVTTPLEGNPSYGVNRVARPSIKFTEYLNRD